MSHIQSTQNTITCDTHDKIRTAQRKLIKDSRELINIAKKYKATIKREGLTRSMHYNTIWSPDTQELNPKFIVNSYARKFLTKCLLNAIYFTFNFNNTNGKQTVQAIQDIRATLARMGYKLAPIESRLSNNQIYRHEARVFNLNGTQFRVDICDYAIRPIYINGYLSVEARYDTDHAQTLAMVRGNTLESVYIPHFSTKGNFMSYSKVGRDFYDSYLQLPPPQLYPSSWSQDDIDGFKQRMRDARARLKALHQQQEVM